MHWQPAGRHRVTPHRSSLVYSSTSLMFTPLTIFRKGILIVSIPLLTQAFFLFALVKSASDTAQAERWAVHTKQVITKLDQSYRRFLEHYGAVRDLIVLERPSH